MQNIMNENQCVKLDTRRTLSQNQIVNIVVTTCFEIEKLMKIPSRIQIFLVNNSMPDM
jgi:hypothetical protein